MLVWDALQQRFAVAVLHLAAGCAAPVGVNSECIERTNANSDKLFKSVVCERLAGKCDGI